MKKFFVFVILLSAMFYNAYASIQKPYTNTTFLGPTLRLAYTSTIEDMNSAYSIRAEAGFRNFRVGGTLGWQLAGNQKIKISAEYLRQFITYSFFADTPNLWLHQGAIGVDYRYDWVGLQPDPQISIQLYHSHSPSYPSSIISGTFINHAGLLTAFTDQEHIAGANAEGMAVGLSVLPWCGARMGLDVNYDNVRYKKLYPGDENAKGFGGTIRFRQALFDDINFSLLAAIRSPFNNYQASLNWLRLPYYGWRVSVDAAYTTGKHTLPNTWDAGVSLSYLLDQRCDTCKIEATKEEILVPASNDFVEFTAEPAVYMPQVLAVPDENVTLLALLP